MPLNGDEMSDGTVGRDAPIGFAAGSDRIHVAQNGQWVLTEKMYAAQNGVWELIYPTPVPPSGPESFGSWSMADQVPWPDPPINHYYPLYPPESTIRWEGTTLVWTVPFTIEIELNYYVAHLDIQVPYSLMPHPFTDPQPPATRHFYSRVDSWTGFTGMNVNKLIRYTVDLGTNDYYQPAGLIAGNTNSGYSSYGNVPLDQIGQPMPPGCWFIEVHFYKDIGFTGSPPPGGEYRMDLATTTFELLP